MKLILLLAVIMIMLGSRVIKASVQTMALAIMEFEGWYLGSRSQRNNNPGNLKYAGQAGAVGGDETGHAIFASFEYGWNALINQIQIAINGKSAVYKPTDTLYDFFAKYAEANKQAYAEFVAHKMNVSPTTQLKDMV